MKDYYYILGINETASPEEIKKAYRKLSTKFHPDKNDGDEFFTDRFKEIHEAYEVLGNPVKRKKYNEEKSHFNNINYYRNLKPEIEFFMVDRDFIEFDIEITFSWVTHNADRVTLKPVGAVQFRGEKKFRIRNIKDRELKFELIAENTNLDLQTNSIISLVNKAFKDINSHDSNVREKEVEQRKIVVKSSNNVGSNSFLYGIIILLMAIGFIYREEINDLLGSLRLKSELFVVSKPDETLLDDMNIKNYKIVKIGNQIWMAENLRTTKYNDGTSIPNIRSKIGWRKLTSDAYCWLNNDIENKNIYGGLYNWYAVNTGKLCPTGWHVPSDAEWTILINYLGGNLSAGSKMKSAYGWLKNGNGSDVSGFSVLPGGNRNILGDLGEPGYGSFMWSSTETVLNNILEYSLGYKEGNNAWEYTLGYQDGKVVRWTTEKTYGMSVRCIKN